MTTWPPRWARPGAGRRGRLARLVRHDLRAARPARGGPDRHGRRLRRRDRPPPADGRHAERRRRAAATATCRDRPGRADEPALSAPGADGVALLPYLDGERTPNRPDATGVLRGLTTQNATAANLARAAIEAVLGTLAEAADLIAAQARPATGSC